MEPPYDGMNFFNSSHFLSVFHRIDNPSVGASRKHYKASSFGIENYRLLSNKIFLNRLFSFFSYKNWRNLLVIRDPFDSPGKISALDNWRGDLYLHNS